MNTCGTCKYKTLDEDGDTIKVYPRIYYLPDVGYVAEDMVTLVPLNSDDTPAAVKEFFLCGRINMKKRMEGNQKFDEKAMVVDGSGYYAALCVEDDFGCVLWEAK